jgi:hypothetical protein
MIDPCPECGAVLRDEGGCQSIFDSLLVLEFTDPGYGEVHFLTVACFMVQHGRYSDAGLSWIQGKLRDVLERGVTAGQIRRQANREADQRTRTWKVTRQPGERPLPKIAWSMTIADVASDHHTLTEIPPAARYRELVTEWARVTLAEMGPLL